MSLPDPSVLIQKIAQDLAHRLQTHESNAIVMVGIHTGGAWVAKALHEALKLETPLGLLGISFYRDDFTQKGLHPEIKSSNLPDIENATVILVDDVVMSGRTIRAAMNELFDYGRPHKVLLASLMDVGRRELPIQPDVCGAQYTLGEGERIKLFGPEPLSFNLIQLNEKEADA